MLRTLAGEFELDARSCDVSGASALANRDRVAAEMLRMAAEMLEHADAGA
jgi:hypothetical protein